MTGQLDPTELVDDAILAFLGLGFKNYRDDRVRQAQQSAGRLLYDATTRYEHAEDPLRLDSAVVLKPKANSATRARIGISLSPPSQLTLKIIFDDGQPPVDGLVYSGDTNVAEVGLFAGYNFAGAVTYDTVHQQLQAGELFDDDVKAFARLGEKRTGALLDRFIAFAGNCVVDQVLTDRYALNVQSDTV